MRLVFRHSWQVGAFFLGGAVLILLVSGFNVDDAMHSSYGRLRFGVPLGFVVGGALLIEAGIAAAYSAATGNSLSRPLSIASLLLGAAVGGGALLALALSQAAESTPASLPLTQPRPLQVIGREISVVRGTTARLVLQETDPTPDCGGSIVDAVSLVDDKGAVAFADSFDDQGYSLGVTALEQWTVAGNVDVIGAGSPFDLYPGNGQYLDLDGSPCAASRIESPPIRLRPGTYVLSFRLGSNPYGGGHDNRLRVQLTDVFVETFES